MLFAPAIEFEERALKTGSQTLFRVFVRHFEFLYGLPLCTRSQTPVPRSPFSVLRSPFSVLRSPFSVLRSPFPVPRSPFMVPRSPFMVPRSPFPVLRFLSPFPVLVTPVKKISKSLLGGYGCRRLTVSRLQISIQLFNSCNLFVNFHEKY